MISYGFIGAGNMGSAIIKGVISSGADAEIYVYEADADKAKALEALGVHLCGSESELVKSCKYVILAVKPQQMNVALSHMREAVTEDTVLISIAAGLTAEYFRRETIPNAKVVLVMPNTPLLLGEGATAISRADGVSDEEFENARRLFTAGGCAEVIEIDKMKEIIAINGSSPAFIYLFAKGFVDYAASVGISADTALKLFSQSLIGSARMLTDSGYSVEELIKMVSSPGGTTLAGLDELYRGNLTEVVDNACKSCTRRAYELSDELTSK